MLPVSVGPKKGSPHPLPPLSKGPGDTVVVRPHADSAYIADDHHPQWLLMLPEVLRARLFAAADTAISPESPTDAFLPLNAMFRGAWAMASAVADHFHLAVRRQQTIGPEVEFFSDQDRTEVIRAIARRYEAAGYPTREIATPFYEFEDSPSGFWETRHQFTIDDNNLAFHLYEGMGGFVVSAKAPFGVQADILSTSSEQEAFERGCVMAAAMLNLPLEQVRHAARAGQKNYLLALKSDDKDYFEVQVELQPDGIAHLKPLTGDLPVQNIRASSLDAVKEYLVHAVRGRQIPKHNIVTKIEVQVPGRAEPLVIDNRFDVYPIQEVVLSPVTAGERRTLTAPLLDFFQRPGMTASGEAIHLQGTNGVNQVGFQVHREVPWRNAQGQPTIEHLLKLYRKWIVISKDVAAAVPTLEARKLFARPLHDFVADAILDPAFITDPTSIAQTFDFFGLIVRNTLPKYNNLNVENWFAHHVKVLRDGGHIRVGDVIESALFSGTDYTVGHDGVIMSYSSGGDVKYVNLVRLPGSHPIPTVELRTPDTVLDPGYMGFFMDFMASFGHDEVGTASREVADLHHRLQQPGLEAIARDFARHPGLPLSIMALLGMKIPELLVAYRLKGLVGDAAVEAMAPYQALRDDPLVGAIAESIRIGGLAAVLGPDANKDPVAQSLHHLTVAGARLSKLVEDVYQDGVIPSQHLGLEVEFDSSLKRNAIFEIIAEAYRRIPGARVTFKHNDRFDFTAKSPLHWTISQPITMNGQTIIAKVASGTGGYVISAIRTLDDARTRAAASPDVLGALHEAKGLVSELAGIDLPAAAGTDPHYLMMCKSTDAEGDSDYFKIDVRFQGGNATLTALNGTFNGAGGAMRTIQIPAHDLEDVERFLQANARGNFASKDSPIKEILVHLPGHAVPFTAKVVYEEHPAQEVVTGKLNARTTDVVRPFLDALSNATTLDAGGHPAPVVDGMRSGNPLAFQVHAEVPYLDAAGKMTVAAFLQLQRNFAAMTDAFSALLGPDANRVAFAPKAPGPYLRRISDPNYASTPTELATILNVFGDYVSARPAKYQDFSVEHFASWFLRTLIQSGTLQPGQTLLTEWLGQTVRYSVRSDVDGSPQVYRGVKTDGGFTAEQPMIRLSAHQPTAELRLPNALFARDGRTAEYVEWLLRITTAFVQTHAQLDSKTIAPGPMGPVDGIAHLVEVRGEAPGRPAPRQGEAPTALRPPTSQTGFVTVGAMADIVTLGLASPIRALFGFAETAIHSALEAVRFRTLTTLRQARDRSRMGLAIPGVPVPPAATGVAMPFRPHLAPLPRLTLRPFSRLPRLPHL